MKSNATQIEEYIDSISAVLVVVNGSIPRVTVGTDYALSTLSTIFPKTLSNNIAFVLTNVPNSLYRNFPSDALPDTLANAPQFLIDNPIVLQRTYLRCKDVPYIEKINFRDMVTVREQNALEMLVELFDWLDGLELYPKMRTVDDPRANEVTTRAPMYQAEAKNLGYAV
jgi:hypothetical protein